MIITGIGSREAPAKVLHTFEEFGKECAKRNWFIRSGHAPGSDYAFEKGATINSIVYLPWFNFNTEDKLLGNPYVPDFPTQWAFDIAKEFNSGFENFTPSVQKLKHRNVLQIFGRDNTLVSDIVVCYTTDGKEVGGTAMNIRIAKHFNIPIINLGTTPMTSEQLLREVETLTN